jgi:hypothetical protein
LNYQRALIANFCPLSNTKLLKAHYCRFIVPTPFKTRFSVAPASVEMIAKPSDDLATEAAKLSERESPRTPSDAMLVDMDTGAEMATTDTL